MLVVSVVAGLKVRRLGERIGQSWRLHVHPQNSTNPAYVRTTGDVKWNLSEIETPTVEFLDLENAIEIQEIRELGMGWAWFVDDLRVFLPAWQDIHLASPFPDEPVSQIDAGVPLEPIPVQGKVAEVAFALYPHERPLAASPFGYPEGTPDWEDTHAISSLAVPLKAHLGTWIRNDMGVCTFQGLGRNGPLWTQVVRRVIRDLPTHQILESLDCDDLTKSLCTAIVCLDADAILLPPVTSRLSFCIARTPS